MKWMPIESAPACTSVLLLYKNEYGKYRRIIAVRYGKFERRSDSEMDDLECEYCEDQDEYFWPAGWYERIENWGDYSHLAVYSDHTLIGWAELPPLPGLEPSTYAQAKAIMDEMTDEERLSLMQEYCVHCGTKHTPCYCTRDD